MPLLFLVLFFSSNRKHLLSEQSFNDIQYYIDFDFIINLIKQTNGFPLMEMHLQREMTRKKIDDINDRRSSQGM